MMMIRLNQANLVMPELELDVEEENLDTISVVGEVRVLLVCRLTLPGVRLWSAKYAFSMKADQIPKIGLLLVFFLLKSLHFWDFS